MVNPLFSDCDCHVPLFKCMSITVFVMQLSENMSFPWKSTSLRPSAILMEILYADSPRLFTLNHLPAPISIILHSHCNTDHDTNHWFFAANVAMQLYHHPYSLDNNWKKHECDLPHEPFSQAPCLTKLGSCHFPRHRYHSVGSLFTLQWPKLIHI